MPTGVRIPADVKAAILAALLAGVSAKEASEQYGVKVATIESWRRKQEHSYPLKKQSGDESIGDLMLIYVKELFGNLIAQLQVTQDADWISTQHADQLAIYHGVLVDKGLRAIEQLARFLDAQRRAEIDE